MKIISICNQKGGVGKTTTARNLAAALALAGKHVLCIDLDPQGNLSDYLGHVPDGLPTITELMMATVQGKPMDPIDAVRKNSEGTYYIPADIRLSGIELALSQAMFREQILRRVLSAPSLRPFDYILVDCLPSLGILLTNALIASHSLVIPVQAQKFALCGIEDLFSIYETVKQQANAGLTVDGILLTMADNTNMSRAVERELRERFPSLIYDAFISRSVEATNSTYTQQSLVSGSGSKLGEQYSKVATEFLERELQHEN